MKQSVRVFVLFLLFIVAFSSAHAVDRHASVLRQYPIPNAIEVSPLTSIGLTASIAFDRDLDREDNWVLVTGSRSGNHAIMPRLSDDAHTLILDPVPAFDFDEEVCVSARMRLGSGAVLIDSFVFKTMRSAVTSPALMEKLRETALLAPFQDTNSIPDTLPALQVLVDRGATPGTYYFANFGLKAPNHNFLFTLDEHGLVIRQRNTFHTNSLDFKVQPNGEITYFDNANWRFVGVDSNWNVIDTFPSANGYMTDMHELLLLPNGGYALLAVSVTTLDSAQFMSGMVPNATVGADVIQIFDAHRNLTFEWRGIDHYRVADAVHENLRDSALDFQHANSLDIDSNGDIIISNRHLSEITKISGRTQEMLWRLGGAHNEFTLLGDSVWFSYQHAARWLRNGHMTLFDNSDFDSVTGVAGYIHHSRALEFTLDTAARTATAVWQWHHNPETFSIAMGNVQRLPNGNTVIGWGLNNNLGITEVDKNDLTVFELTYGPKNVSYRVFKDPVPDSLLNVVTAPEPAAMNAWYTTSDNGGRVHYVLDRPERITVAVCDVLGREVLPRTSVYEQETEQSVAIPTQSLLPGSYYCTLRSESGRSGTVSFVVVR